MYDNADDGVAAPSNADEPGVATSIRATSCTVSCGTPTTGHLATGVGAAELDALPSVVAARCFNIVQSKT